MQVDEQKLTLLYDLAPVPPAARTVSLAAHFGRDPSLRPRFERLRRHAAGISGSNYDVSDTCNLRCEGCLYFAGADRDGHGDVADDAAWAALFAAERRRGVNFAYLAGGEPALAPSRLRLAAAEHIGRGVVFTNGTVRIDERLPFAVHVSVWGDRDGSARLRGGDSFEKAFRLHGGAARARFVMTVNAQNVEGAWAVAARCAAAGSRLSFSIFSPTEQYRAQLAGGVPDTDYFRVSTAEAHLIPGPDDLATIRRTLDAVAARHPATVLYTPAYSRWVTAPDGLYDIDPATGWARDCGTRRTARHRHYRTDLSSSTSKCCSPNIDCSGCRAYSMATGTAVSRFRRFAATYDGFRDWLDMSEQWAALFLREWPA